MLQKKSALKQLIWYIAILMVAVAAFVYIMDPFYQYHDALAGKKAALYDREHQVIGTIRNFEYDSVLLGSSVAENFDTEYLNKQYDCKTLKVIRASGSIADLLYYMDMVHEKQELKNVFWCMDVFALMREMEVSLYQNVPAYLHTETILDDGEYLYNKDVLFQKIPLSVAYSLLERNTGGHAYDWSANKQFGAEYAIRHYAKPKEANPVQNTEAEEELFAENMKSVLAEIKGHPQTKYTIMFPPYSLLWWDSGYVNGYSQMYLQVLEEAIPQLLACENVEIHFFMAEEEIVCDLSHYMDMLHYSPQINQFMLEALSSEEYRVKPENVNEVLEEMHRVHDVMVQEDIYKYY